MGLFQSTGGIAKPVQAGEGFAYQVNLVEQVYQGDLASHAECAKSSSLSNSYMVMIVKHQHAETANFCVKRLFSLLICVMSLLAKPPYKPLLFGKHAFWERNRFVYI